MTRTQLRRLELEKARARAIYETHGETFYAIREKMYEAQKAWHEAVKAVNDAKERLKSGK
jgi:hypothetical protein